MGCVGFFNKNDNFSSFHQCLKACDFKKVPGAKPTQAYSCVDYYTPCTALTFYYIPSYLNHFLEWTQCLEVCHLLTNGTVEAFMKCYVECQVTKTENQTHQNYMYVCNPSSRQCIDSLFFTQPEEKEPSDVLEKCYMDCGNGGAASPEPELFKCDQDSKSCKACNEEDDNCSDLATCEDSCQGEHHVYSSYSSSSSSSSSSYSSSSSSSSSSTSS
nr:unnamed protein product [Spirometra erinaceieuropaei]